MSEGSFTAMPPTVLANSRHVSEEDFQIALAPYIQSYLSQAGRRHSCCSVMLPVAFERAAPKSWMDPCFDSAVLEGQYQASVFPQIRLRFRFALIYILLCSLVWMIYFSTDTGPKQHRVPLSLAFAAILSIAATLLWVTYSEFYRAHMTTVSSCTAIGISVLSLFFLILTTDSLSPLGHFAICVQIVLLIYTVIPLHLWQNFGIAVVYSVGFEALTFYLASSFYINGKSQGFGYRILALRVLLQICVHLIGAHVLVMNVVRMRGTFMKVGQNLLVRRQLEMEKQLKEKMIHSVMPPKVADMLLKEVGPAVDASKRNQSRLPRMRTSNDVKSLFRPFHMHSMDNVSILFADIVGFTKMSSTKTAEQLVEILNDLFERFDELCLTSGCEKISTLGDCYYCVSGCPEPRKDHAVCCVEMGLGMIDVMRVFETQRQEQVTMRVGVHTGTVLCGIVGTRRVKFDVWSNDVTFANKMESSGRPEQVHVSEVTSSLISEHYNLEDGEEVDGQRTFFVINRRKERHNSDQSEIDVDLSSSNKLMSRRENGVAMSLSIMNVSTGHPSVPPASPVGVIASTSLNPSPILGQRPRQAHLHKVTKYLSGSITNNTKESTHKMPKCGQPIDNPKIVISTRSLPESLASDHEDDGCCRASKATEDTEIPSGKYVSKIRGWKIPKFLRKTDDSIYEKTMPIVTTTNYRRKPEELSCMIAVDDQPIGSTAYCPLPIVIETPSSPITGEPANLLDVPNRISTHCSFSSSRSPEPSGSSTGQHSMFDEIIDVRSYISQSRSDISPFGRTGSYRSQTASKCLEMSPHGRPRALTVHSAAVNGGNPWDILSICPSAHSRKDSGIRSNSRRSSIQQQIYVMNQSQLSQQRVSGYFTSSQSSIGDVPEPVVTPADPNPDPLGACLQQLRKQSDLQLIRCVRDNAKSQRSYLVKPPLSAFSLFFKSLRMEHEFRGNAHRFGCELQSEGPPTLATPKFNTFIDFIICLIVYFSISASLFLLSITDRSSSYQIWVIVFSVFTIAQFLALFIFTKQIRHFNAIAATKKHESFTCVERIFEWISSWYPWHICLAVLMSLPVVLIILNFLMQDFEKLVVFEYQYGFMVFVCIIHFCNFTQLNCWMRNALAVLTAVAFVGISLGQLGETSMYRSNSANTVTTRNNTRQIDTEGVHSTQNAFQAYHVEIYLDLMLVLVLVWFLNREFEIGYRLAFYGNAVAQKDKIQVQNMKNQADILLHNIIPKHVAEQLKNTAKYSENHRSVAIIFASIVNFNELYDESYLGGKEYLRVLNELIGDFDELLSRPEFRSVEKIKTIGSTFMAASGLDPQLRGDGDAHIFALMDFAVAMQNVVKDFNKDLLEFNLILRIGLNVGDVTAGVIGTSKLHYDIWGDAVNVASRMDSTGVAGRIQVGQAGVNALEKVWKFEARGKIYVKGKDHMEVYLVKQHNETEIGK